VTVQRPTTADERYSKAIDIWYLLHSAEQLVINDPDYHPNVVQMLTNCMDIVETLQHDIEASGQ
jgi:hypothetical protein